MNTNLEFADELKYILEPDSCVILEDIEELKSEAALREEELVAKFKESLNE